MLEVMPLLMPCILFPDLKSKGSASDSEKEYEIADIFRLYWDDYIKNNPVTNQQHKVVFDILNCRSGKYGYNINVCDKCAHTEIFPNSCRNRNCPKCQGNKRIKWTESRINDLLPVSYYHIVFTLPDKIFPMCLYNQALIYNLLLSCAAETLKQFGEDPKWLGGQIGFFSILHTWGQLLQMHPHIHIIIPGGAYDAESGSWIWPKYEKNNFLFPIKALSKVFRGKFIAGLKKAFKNNELNFPGSLNDLRTEQGFESWLNSLVSKNWIVYSKPPFGGPENVIKYVSRYIQSSSISNSRIISIDNGIVRFMFKNYKKKNKVKNYKELWEETQLPADEFIRRFLYHILPRHYQRIRHYGYLGTNQKIKRLEILKVLEYDENLKIQVESECYEGMPCPECESGILIPIVVVNGYGMILQGSFTQLRQFRETIIEKFECDTS